MPGGYFFGEVEYTTGEIFEFNKGWSYIHPSELKLLGYHSVVYEHANVKGKNADGRIAT